MVAETTTASPAGAPPGFVPWVSGISTSPWAFPSWLQDGSHNSRHHIPEQILCRDIEGESTRKHSSESHCQVKSSAENLKRHALGLLWPKPCPVTTHNFSRGWESRYPSFPASVVGSRPGKGPGVGYARGTCLSAVPPSTICVVS